MDQHHDHIGSFRLQFGHQRIGGVRFIGEADAFDAASRNQIGGALQRHADKTDCHLRFAIAEFLEAIGWEQRAAVSFFGVGGEHAELGTCEGLVDAAWFGLGELFAPA